MNPFVSSKIVGEKVTQAQYSKEEYKRGDPRFVMRRSHLAEFAHNPRRWIDGYERKETGSTDYGDRLDCLILTPELFESRFTVAPETYTAEAKKKGDPHVQKPWNRNATFCSEWEELYKVRGIEVLKPSEFEPISKAAGVMKSHPEIAPIFQGANFQVHVEATYWDKETDVIVPVKVLIDIVPAFDDQEHEFYDALFDLKTAVSGDPSMWNRTVFKYGYAMQGKLYLDAYNAVGFVDKRQSFGHIIQESSPPFHVTTPIPLLDNDFMEIGRLQYVGALQYYAKCLKTGVWPGYRPTPNARKPFQFITPIEWMTKQVVEQGIIDNTEEPPAPTQPTNSEEVTP